MVIDQDPANSDEEIIDLDLVDYKMVAEAYLEVDNFDNPEITDGQICHRLRIISRRNNKALAGEKYRTFRAVFF